MPLHPDGDKLLAPQDIQDYWDFDTPACQAFLGDASFLDLYHLNTTGAPKFTQAIAALYAQQIDGQTIGSPEGLRCAQVIQP